MVYQSNAPVPLEPRKPNLVHAIKTMPRWKWRVLTIGLVIGCIGVAGQAITFMRHTSPAATTVVVAPRSISPGSISPGNLNTPAGSSGFVGGQQGYPTTPPAVSTGSAGVTPEATGDPSQSVSPAWTPFMTKVGFSLFVGIVVGLIFRTFFRVALMFTTLIVGAAAALSYFHILNVDLTMVKDQAAQATNWISDQGMRLKDMLFQALPSSTSAAIGFLLGFKRR